MYSPLFIPQYRRSFSPPHFCSNVLLNLLLPPLAIIVIIVVVVFVVVFVFFCPCSACPFSCLSLFLLDHLPSSLSYPLRPLFVHPRLFSFPFSPIPSSLIHIGHRQGAFRKLEQYLKRSHSALLFYALHITLRTRRLFSLLPFLSSSSHDSIDSLIPTHLLHTPPPSPHPI